MLILETLQSLVFVAVLLAVVFFSARVITDGEIRHLASTRTPQRVSLAHLMAKPEPAAAPRAHLRLVHSGPGMPEDVPFDQMKELAR
ncbi:hypothetical protein [Arthrobacter sp. ES1]|uniref:hypothetical protein n=1 Tax=Arthrobacter sp. ES1 TaxID=1897056 RepID=UPI001CFFE76D|nr:hypothetical protein [Arthrobacter sp. ES1]MCB5281117.1 hypothetical protein [Arthrobacter sp. ES1]